jgi:dihydroxy-acid dehydratase
VRNGDRISIDARKREINLEVEDAQLVKRLDRWKSPKPRYTRGVLAKYARQVSSASKGAVTDDWWA